MIVAASQPYFSPYPGFFCKAQLADALVLLDTVQFPRGTTWLSRNRFKNDQGAFWLTVPVWKKGLGLQPIREVRMCHAFDWVKKHLQSLKTSYANAPYLADHLPFIEDAYLEKFDKLVELNLALTLYLLQQLQIDTRVMLLSQLGIGEKGSRLPVEICRRMGASVYLAQAAAGKYLDAALFRQAGIALEFFRPPAPVYPQLWGPFIANLSSFDLLFNCGPKAHAILCGPRD